MVLTHRCGAKWSGTSRAHCAGCHETFSCDTNFDLHRKSFTCYPPDCGGKLLPRENEYGTVIWTGASGGFDRSTLRKQMQ